jgi:hypothetical protein
MSLNPFAQRYVQLVLSVGQHDPSYVDAYYGPPEWQAQVATQALPELLLQGERLAAEFAQVTAPTDEALRTTFLGKHIEAVCSHIRHLMGQRQSFDAESQALYDAVSPRLLEAELAAIVSELDSLLPGTGSVQARMVAFNRRFEIPLDRLDAVFSAAITESRQRSKRYISLPEHERFAVEYVQNQVWSAYNWYKGNSYSLIQVNTDLPMPISRAIDLASHEGYPGHHVFHLLTEQHLVREKGWLEYSVFPLYSPMAFLSEGSANYGISVVFPPKERLVFEQNTLFPLAGLDPHTAEHYYQVQGIVQKLSYAGNMVAQRYLDGEVDRAGAIALLMQYALYDEKRATQRLAFIEHNRSYVINYNLGQDAVQRYVEAQAGASANSGNTNDKADALWQAFKDLLLAPRTASMMTVAG